jgi:hypothetical protein
MALAIHPLSKLRDLSKLRGILANRIKVLILVYVGFYALTVLSRYV